MLTFKTYLDEDIIAEEFSQEMKNVIPDSLLKELARTLSTQYTTRNIDIQKSKFTKLRSRTNLSQATTEYVISYYKEPEPIYVIFSQANPLSSKLVFFKSNYNLNTRKYSKMKNLEYSLENAFAIYVVTKKNYKTDVISDSLSQEKKNSTQKKFDQNYNTIVKNTFTKIEKFYNDEITTDLKTFVFDESLPSNKLSTLIKNFDVLLDALNELSKMKNLGEKYTEEQITKVDSMLK